MREGLFLNLETYALPRKNSLEKIDLIEAEPEASLGSTRCSTKR